MTKYRQLLAVSLLLYITVNAFAYLAWDVLPEDTRKIMRFDGYGSPLESLGLYVWAIFLILYLIAYFGLFYKKNWAWILFILLHVGYLVISAIGGVRVFHGVEYALTHLLLLLNGIIIAIIFLKNSDNISID